MNGEITVLVNGAVQWRFHPHQMTADEVITLRQAQYPPVPIGAELLVDGQPLGTVRCVRREVFNRWALVFDPVDGSRQTVDGGDGASASISQEIIASGDAVVSVDLSRSDIPDSAVVGLAVVDGAVEVTVGTPIAALADHLDPRVMGTVEQLADTVEELNAKTDAALRAIDGIGPKRLEEIRAACAAALHG
ncbi:MAG TPA: hypothetical protein PKH77_05190 [Anaerolineae bacterium]|nr:hypothetical protein [Anaerolineae bacterium]